MKTHLILLAFFNLALINPTRSEVNPIKNDNLPKNDTFISDSARSENPYFFDSTDYSIEIQDSNGTKVNLGNWRGKNLLVIYAHPDCPYCKKLVEKFESELNNSAITTMVLFSRLDTSEIKDFRKETSLNYPYFIDSAFQFRKKYGAGIVPLTLYINSDGTAERIAGLKEKAVESLIQKINKG
jgi:peroxiredoxin